MGWAQPNDVGWTHPGWAEIWLKQIGSRLAQQTWANFGPKQGLGRFRPNKLYFLFFLFRFFPSLSYFLFFFHSFFFFCSHHPPFFSPSSPRGEGVFIRGRGARATLPLSSHGDEVGWLGRPLCNHPRVACRACLPCPFHHGGRSWGGVDYVRVFGQEGG